MRPDAGPEGLSRLNPRRWLRTDSLVGRLVRRLLPALFILLIIDLLATWYMTGILQPEPWQLRDLFWAMLLLQAVLIFLFVWVLVSGVRAELASVRRLGHEIRQRSVDDLQPFDGSDLPAELAPLVQHFNGLLLKLDDSVQAQRRFVGQAAHQLRTPLAGLKLESELMLSQDLDDDVRARVVRIKAVTDRMIRMGQQLLVLARADHSMRPQDAFVRLDLCEWMRQAGSRWLDVTRAQGIRLQLEAPPGAVLVDADPLLLTELLGNLIDNALCDAMPMRTIVLRVLANPPAFSVEDDGVGIPAGDLGRIFEPFYRPSGAHPGGSGLGLAIVREIAHAHGAWVKASSRPEFPGTRVVVVFPGPRRGASLRAGGRHRDGHATQDAPRLD
ncbi:sensor histidine kinase [Castellaniella sp.]|uniref:sensor histidine kinase n=1 Tax=Castellaniella sp. TaxID=1955812 RepID=UPI003566AEA3